jgi:hypothetical protein
LILLEKNWQAREGGETYGDAAGMGLGREGDARLRKHRRLPETGTRELFRQGGGSRLHL